MEGSSRKKLQGRGIIRIDDGNGELSEIGEVVGHYSAALGGDCKSGEASVVTLEALHVQAVYKITPLGKQARRIIHQIKEADESIDVAIGSGSLHSQSIFAGGSSRHSPELVERLVGNNQFAFPGEATSDRAMRRLVLRIVAICKPDQNVRVEQDHQRYRSS